MAGETSRPEASRFRAGDIILMDARFRVRSGAAVRFDDGPAAAGALRVASELGAVAEDPVLALEAERVLADLRERLRPGL